MSFDISAIAKKSLIKSTMNVFVPGSGAVVEFASAANNLKNGKPLDAAIDVAFGCLEFVSFGMASAAKETTVKQVYKCLSISSANIVTREMANEIIKMVERQFMIALEKRFADDILMGLLKSGGNDVAQNTFEEIFEKVFNDIMTKILADTANDTFSSAVIEEAKKNAKEHALKMFKAELALNAAIGACNAVKSDQDN